MRKENAEVLSVSLRLSRWSGKHFCVHQSLCLPSKPTPQSLPTPELNSPGLDELGSPGSPLSDGPCHLCAPETQTQLFWPPFTVRPSSQPATAPLLVLIPGHHQMCERQLAASHHLVHGCWEVRHFQIRFGEPGNFTAMVGQSHLRADSKRGFWAQHR